MAYLNEEQTLILETGRRMFRDLCGKNVVDAAEAGQWPTELWQTLELSGLTLAGVPETAGGVGGSIADSLLLAREAAGFAAPIPLAETSIAYALLAEVGAECGGAPIAVVAAPNLSIKASAAGVELSGSTETALYLEHCPQLLIVSSDQICLLATANLPDSCKTQRKRMSGEVETRLNFDHDLAVIGVYTLANAELRLRNLGAAMRVNQMAGAMTSILEMSVNYALERVQFGRPLSKFQAIQQQLATLAGEVATCQRAADSVLYSLSDTDVAVAKARVGEAVTQVADIAHQVHGAMGYTLEHGLNLLTRRLWEWRDDYGDEVYWQIALGRSVCTVGADQVWSWVAETA